MFSKIKTALILTLALAIAALSMHSIYILRMTDDELTFDNLFKTENIVLSIMLIIIVLGVLYVSGDFGDEDK